MRKSSRPKKWISAAAALILCLALTACGGSGASSPEPASRAAEPSQSAALSAEGGSGGYEVPKFRGAKFHEDKAEGNEEVQVDLSAVSKGYIALVCDTDARVKLQIFKGEEAYVYDVVMGKTQIFPLQSGDGTYVIRVMKNLEDNKYFELYKCEAEVKLKSEFEPYLRPNQYADYSESSECVKKAAEIAQGARDEEEFIMGVFDFVCDTVKYDYDKAETVESGYIPDPDSIMKEGKGICFDYASLSASMLRSQGIPTKIIFGYVAPDELYHAWNMFYTEKKGWTSVEFSVSPEEWSRIDTTFSANGADGKFIGDGSNYTDVYQY